MRRAIAFAELLQHPNLVRMKGTWESDDIIFVGETAWKQSQGAAAAPPPPPTPAEQHACWGVRAGPPHACCLLAS